MLVFSGKSLWYWCIQSVSAPVPCCIWVDLINKARDPARFSRVASLQSCIDNTGINSLDTACIFQSNVWMHMPERFSSLLTLPGGGESQPPWRGLKCSTMKLAGVFYQSCFLLAYVLGALLLCSGWMSPFFSSWYISLMCWKLQVFPALCTPWELGRQMGGSSGAITRWFFLKDLDRGVLTAGETAILATMRVTWKSHALLPLVKDMTSLLTQLCDTLN